MTDVTITLPLWFLHTMLVIFGVQAAIMAAQLLLQLAIRFGKP